MANAQQDSESLMLASPQQHKEHIDMLCSSKQCLDALVAGRLQRTVVHTVGRSWRVHRRADVRKSRPLNPR